MGRKQASAKAKEAATKEKELLEAIRHKGGVGVVGRPLEPSLSVEEADRILSMVAARRHLEDRVDSARMTYSLWEGRG